MGAKIIEMGIASAGFSVNGEIVFQNLAMVQAQVPSPKGDWMYVVIENSFCWVKGLPANQGYEMYKLPLTGAWQNWRKQILAYYKDGPDEGHETTFVPAGIRTVLVQDTFFIIAD